MSSQVLKIQKQTQKKLLGKTQYTKTEQPNGMISIAVKGYKFVTENLKSKNGDTQWVPKEWQKCEGTLTLCNNGFHASHTPLDSLQYTYGDRWFMVEAKGVIVEGDDKFCAREMRLTQELPVDKILVQFAILCARRCYKNYKKAYPDDKVVWAAIVAAEKCLVDPSPENLSAARSAARSNTSAAWSATSAARSAESATSAVWSAARSNTSAARSADSAAASAARSAASAAWSATSAARSATSAVWSAESAESAARSAASAARSATRSNTSAAWSAESAARSAEKQWQQKNLHKLIRKALKTEVKEPFINPDTFASQYQKEASKGADR